MPRDEETIGDGGGIGGGGTWDGPITSDYCIMVDNDDFMNPYPGWPVVLEGGYFGTYDPSTFAWGNSDGVNWTYVSTYNSITGVYDSMYLYGNLIPASMYNAEYDTNFDAPLDTGFNPPPNPPTPPTQE